MFHAQFPGLRAYKSTLCSNGCTYTNPAWQLCCDPCRIYIPLWFYLYDLGFSLQGLSVFNLHSTMVLLIRKSFRSRTRIYLFTFHYGSTYTLLPTLLPCRRFIIYIPLWFYLYDKFKSVWNTLSSIYIPLWFYLYQQSLPERMSDINLHSTMVLLIHSGQDIWWD